jgi:hemerythrin-like domain-containing protein
MKITDRLKVEHGVFLQQLRVLRSLIGVKAPNPILAAVVETIAVAEEQHSQIEEQTLYPALAKVLGPGSSALVTVAGEHAALRQRVAKIRGGAFDLADVKEFADLLYDHLEREIHTLFALADEWLTETQLVSMCNWNVEHVYDAVGQRDVWMRDRLSMPRPFSAHGERGGEPA